MTPPSHLAATCAALLAAAGCAAEPAGPVDLVLPRSPAIHLAPHQEIPSICVSFALDNDEPLLVQAVEMDAGPGFHHAAWFWVAEDVAAGPDGVWPCEERGFDWQSGLVDGGLLFGQSTQALRETQAFGRGAILIPPRSRIVGDVHLINGGDAPIDTTVGFTLRVLSPDAEVAILRALYFSIRALAIPPRTTSRFTTECEILHDDFSIHYVLPHYHDLARGMTIEARDDGGAYREVFATQRGQGEVLGRALDPSFPMRGRGSLRFGCTYDNPGDETVPYGYQDEMCNFLAYTDSASTWMGGALDAATPVRRGDDDGVQLYDVPCDYVLALGD
jgi:hypothetical protein